ncbi:hypothetical protein C8J57DRAFT_1564519 [Mycena rebaudengoi]|nr:hypothetical protein C8J57DRAFT_1564519 [Mycena rebaudengoi]
MPLDLPPRPPQHFSLGLTNPKKIFSSTVGKEQQSTKDEMRERVEKALDEADGSWIVDGNYKRRIGSIVEDNCTDVISRDTSIVGLDPPLALYFPRLIIRTFLRMFRLREPCSPGCPEMAMEMFVSKESIVWWCLTHHWPVRECERANMALIGLNVGSDVQNQKNAKARRMGRRATNMEGGSSANGRPQVKVVTFRQ